MRRKKLTGELAETTIESLSHEGRGIAHVNGKTVFVDNALPGERIRFKYTGSHRRYDDALAVDILQPAPERQEPCCAHFGICGGCSLQHMQSAFQMERKQAVLLEQLQHIGRVRPEQLLPPLTGPQTAYRHKARLGVKYVLKKEKLLIGFREKRSNFIADIDICEVLHPAVGRLIPQLRELLAGLSIYEHIPQIEVAAGDNSTVLVLRVLRTPSAQDEERLCDFEKQHGIVFYLQPGGVDSIKAVSPGSLHSLSYELPDYGIEMLFSPVDFTQVNFAMNKLMINRVLGLLEPAAGDRIIDLFCGMGNFTLPLAKRAGYVVGVEGSDVLVDKARGNAAHNHISNVEFHAMDLAKGDVNLPVLRQPANKLLLDPPRTGAQEVIEQINMDDIDTAVYVSCNPATLARDAGLLVREQGFTLKQAGVMDMFPHTAHVESLALFQRD